MKKLISMTDFVLQQQNPDFLELCEFEENSYKIYNYAKFLKQPLELWMFVPCDEEGNVMEEPNNQNSKYDIFEGQDCIFNDSLYYYDLNQYKQAKKRCLFVWQDEYDYSFICEMFSSIEDIIPFQFELTPTSIKQIEL